MNAKHLLIAGLLFCLVACGNDSGTSLGNIDISNKSISGVCQKGPFVIGSSVKLYELDGKNLGQTGKSFSGKINKDNGEFSVNVAKLDSRYVLLEANGYFRNEVTGGKSGSPITLNALADLSNREKVNINLLTHLEYERVVNLIESGKGVAKAKSQAEAEILKVFGLREEFMKAEDVNIFGNSEESAWFLALSVLMLGNLSEAEFSERLALFALDFGKSGEWNDETTKAKIADWAMEMDLNGELENIRSNVGTWNLGNVPPFEKYVRNFWYAEYGLDSCTAKNESVVAANANKNSGFYETGNRFICRSGNWIFASDSEKDTYGWNETDDRLVKKGNVTETYYKYEVNSGKWIEADENDVNVMSACTATQVGEIVKTEEMGEYYCSEKGWISLNEWSWDVPKNVRFNPEVSYDSLVDKRDGKIYRTVKIGSQVWMAENLRYAIANSNYGNSNYGNCEDSLEEHCEIAGYVYAWLDAIDSAALANDSLNPLTCGHDHYCELPKKVRGICPEGWHLPDSTEWATLIETVGGRAVAANVLKSARGGWYNGSNGTDDFGFSVIPVDNSFHEFDYESGSYAGFWGAGMAKEPGSTDCYGLSFYIINRYGVSLGGGLDLGVPESVRCLKDE